MQLAIIHQLKNNSDALQQFICININTTEFATALRKNSSSIQPGTYKFMVENKTLGELLEEIQLIINRKRQTASQPDWTPSPSKLALILRYIFSNGVAPLTMVSNNV